MNNNLPLLSRETGPHYAPPPAPAGHSHSSPRFFRGMRMGMAYLVVGLWGWAIVAPTQAQPADQPRARVLLIVDSSVYPEIESGLENYAQHIRREFNIVCMPRPDRYYGMQPPQIRAILKEEYDKGNAPPLVGAIFVGPIPHACRTHDPREILIPCPLYYEDFDAEWVDADGDGYFEKVRTDRKTNATEIWTAWWIPPANDGPSRAWRARRRRGTADITHRTLHRRHR